jgi:hypothetical protein
LLHALAPLDIPVLFGCVLTANGKPHDPHDVQELRDTRTPSQPYGWSRFIQHEKIE